MSKFLLCILLALVASSVRAAEPGLFELHAVADKPSATTREYFCVFANDEPPRKVLLEQEVLLDGSALRSAALRHTEQTGQPHIYVVLTEEGAKRFGEITTKFVHKQLGIILGGQLQSAPIVNVPILGGSLDISGNSTEQQAADLVTRLNASAPKKN